MKKKFLLISVLAMLFVAMFAATAYAADEDFTISDGVLTKYTGTDTDVVIPNAVKEIGSSAFKENKTIKSVVIPDSVTVIGTNAFYYCSNLESVTMSKKVQKIAAYAFYNCSSLKSIELPEGLKSIGSYVFYYCRNVEEFKLPSTLTSIGANAFQSCYALKEITIPKNVAVIGTNVFSSSGITTLNVDKNNAFFSTYQNGLYDKSKTVLYWMSKEQEYGSFTFPSTLRVIEGGALNGCKFTKLTINAGMTRLLSSGLSGMQADELVIPASVTYIDNYINDYISTGKYTVNSNNKNYTSVNGILYDKNKTILMASPKNYIVDKFTIPSTVKEIGQYAFYYSNIREIIVPSTVETIGYCAFYDASSKITVMNGVKTICNDAFEYCGAEDIIIPSSVKYVESSAFYGFYYDVYVKAGATGFSSSAFSGFNHSVYAFPGTPAYVSAEASGATVYSVGTEITDVYFAGTGNVVEWNEVSIADGYYVYRALPGGKYTFLGGTSTGTKFTDKTAVVGKTYYYKVVPYGKDSAGKFHTGTYSPAKSVKTDTRQVGDLKFSSDGKIIVSWDEVKGAAGYYV